MKHILIILFLFLSVSAIAQQGSLSQSVYKSRVNDTTATAFTDAIAAAVAAGYGYWFWNNQATTPHMDIYTDAGVEHVFTFAGSGGSGGSVNTLAPNIQTGDYTIQANDTTDIIYMRNASTPQTATIPSGLKVGSTFVIVQDTTATTTVACTGCDLIGTATLTAKEVSVWHHRETGKYVRLGSSGSGTPGGADTQVQYNDAGAFNGEADFAYNETTNTLTVDNAAVDTEVYDATGWNGDLTVPTKDAVRDKIETMAGTPAGANTQVQYNASGSFGAEAAFTYDAGTNTLDVDVATVDTEAYDATGWNGDLSVPTKDAVRDKVESLVSNKVFVIALSDEVSAISAGTAKMTFRMPYGMTVTEVRASLNVAQTGSGAGGLVTIAIKEGGVGILSTALTIDNGEKTSTTAATPAVISDSSLADDAEMTIDITTIGDGTAIGCKVYFIGNFIIFFLFPVGLIRKMKRLLILALLTIPTIVDAQVMVSSYRHYCEEYKAILVEATTQGWQPPSDLQKRKDNRAIKHFKDNSIWSKFDIFFGMTGNSDFARIDWVNPTGTKLTFSGALSFDATNGYTGDGSNYADTGWVPNSSTKFTQNSCAVGWAISVGSATTGVSDFGSGNDASLTNGLNMNTRNASDQMVFRLNRTTLNTTNNSNSTGRYLLQRSASNAWQEYRNGASQNTGTGTSSGRSTFSVYLWASNAAGTAGAFSTRTMNLFWAGEVMTGLEATLDNGLLIFK